MSRAIELKINGNSHGKMHPMSVQNRIVSAFTTDIKLGLRNIDSIKIMGLDASCDLFIGAMELGGVTNRNLGLYTYIKKFRDGLEKLFEQNKMADSICMDEANEGTLAYATANTQRNVNYRKMDDFRNMLTRLAWRAKIA